MPSDSRLELQSSIGRPLHLDVPRHRHGHDPEWLSGLHPAAITLTDRPVRGAAGTHDQTELNGGHGPHCRAWRAPGTYRPTGRAHRPWAPTEKDRKPKPRGQAPPEPAGTVQRGNQNVPRERSRPTGPQGLTI